MKQRYKQTRREANREKKHEESEGDMFCFEKSESDYRVKQKEEKKEGLGEKLQIKKGYFQLKECY